MVDNWIASLAETMILFFSFSLCLPIRLLPFTFPLKRENQKGIVAFLDRHGSLTAVTVYSSNVGLFYQLVLQKFGALQDFKNK